MRGWSIRGEGPTKNSERGTIKNGPKGGEAITNFGSNGAGGGARNKSIFKKYTSPPLHILYDDSLRQSILTMSLF